MIDVLYVKKKTKKKNHRCYPTMWHSLSVMSVLAWTSSGETQTGVTPPPPTSFVEPAAPLPIPTPQQLRYQGGMNDLIHFGMATFFHDGDPGCDKNNWNGCDPNGGCNSSKVLTGCGWCCVCRVGC